MVLKRRIILRIAWLAALLPAACFSDGDHRHPKSTASIVMAGHTQHNVLMSRATGVSFLLPAVPPGSGLSWVLLGNNVKVLEQTSGVVPRSDGSPGFQCSFYSLKPGRSLVRFGLIDPAADVAVPEGRFEASVTVKPDPEDE